MDWQQLAVAILIVIAAAYVLTKAVASWRVRASGCGGGCCGAGRKNTGLISTDDITARLHRRSEPEV